MTRSEVLLDFIGTELVAAAGEGALTADDELLTTGLVNSLGLMRLIAFIRDELGTEVPYEDILIENFRTVRSIDGYLAGRDGA